VTLAYYNEGVQYCQKRIVGMKYIISGTDRKGSNSLKISHLIKNIYAEKKEDVEIIDLSVLELSKMNGPFYGKETPPDALKNWIDKLGRSDGLVMVVPEYNGSYPGVLKYFIDHWKYPETFEFRPVCFVGLGGMFGGLRPVEHLQQVFGYRNAFIYPERVFLLNVWKNLSPQGDLLDLSAVDLLKKQRDGFQKFCRALIDSGLHSQNQGKR
jgi:chromate reductase